MSPLLHREPLPKPKAAAADKPATAVPRIVNPKSWQCAVTASPDALLGFPEKLALYPLPLLRLDPRPPPPLPRLLLPWEFDRRTGALPEDLDMLSARRP